MASHSESAGRGLSFFCCARRKLSRAVQQDWLGAHLLGNAPVHGEPALVNANVIVREVFHAGTVAQAWDTIIRLKADRRVLG